MTLYDVHCRACDSYFEAWQDRSAKGPFKCPKCGKKRAYRTILKPVAFHSHYSPLHPRASRGKGIGRVRK
jgi:putative FmdB family regulatory protein